MPLALQRSLPNVKGAGYKAPLLFQHLNRSLISSLLVVLFLWTIFPVSLDAGSKPKTDKFTGYVVAAGPKSITVKSKQNIYQVRTFNYSPAVEQQVTKKKLQPGAKITVHYTRGTDVAVKLK